MELCSSTKCGAVAEYCESDSNAKTVSNVENIDNPVSILKMKQQKIDDALLDINLVDEFHLNLMSDSLAKLYIYHGHQCDIKKKLLDLMKNNMKAMYKASGWSWNDKKKLNELSVPEARLLVCVELHNNQNLLGFSHFRFLLDEDNDPIQPVLYIYEMQLAPHARRKGLGRKMLMILQQIASRKGMVKIMLTVFKTNTAALAFYDAEGFLLDASTPSKWGCNVGYEILSRPVE